MPSFGPSPYRPGMGIDPPYLGDRTPQIDRFKGFLRDRGLPHNVLVTGLRGVGKTVLLHQYALLAEEAGWLVAEREFSEAYAQPRAFARSILDDLLALTRRLSTMARLKRAAGSLAAPLADFLGGLTVSYGDFEVGHQRAQPREADHRGFDRDLADALGRLGELCLAHDIPGFVLQYDEFHVVREPPGQLTLSALLAAVADVQRRGAPVMLVLSGLPPMVDHLMASKSYAERMFTRETLDNLAPPEDARALVDPALRLGRHVEPEVVAGVLADTAGYPYFIQVYGHALWNGAPGTTITAADLDRLRPGILADLDRGFFALRYAKVPARERAVLRAVAAHGERARTRDVEHGTGFPTHAIQPLLASLTRRGLIYRPERGVVAFTTPLFGAFLRRQND